MPLDKTKFLFIRFSSIGDIILTTPLLRVLKSKLPDSDIHFLTKKKYFEIVQHNPNIDKIHLLDNNYNDLIKNLKSESFDYIIDLHNNARTLRVKNSLKRLSFTFDKLNFKKWLIVNFKINRLPEIHIVDRYFKTLNIFDIENDNKGLDYFFNEAEVKESLASFQYLNKNYIAFAIGANHATKRLPQEKVIELCNQLEIPVVLLGDENDAVRGEEISQKSTATIFNACGKYSFNESVLILKQSTFVITHDTGLMHVAAAMNKKIISIWGNTIPEFGMYPYMPETTNNYKIAEVKNLKCRPCSKIGFDSCPKKHFKCMNNIDISELSEIAKAY